MFGIRPYLAVLCALMLLAPAGGFAADPPHSPPNQTGAGAPQPIATQRNGVIERVSGPYRPVQEPPNNMTNSTRIETLLRAGNLYLSMQDTIALALENNLDIAIQRYGPGSWRTQPCYPPKRAASRAASPPPLPPGRQAPRSRAAAPRPAPMSAPPPSPAMPVRARSAPASSAIPAPPFPASIPY